VLNSPTRYIDPDGADEVVWNSGSEVTVYGDNLDAPSAPKPLSLDGIPIATQYLPFKIFQEPADQVAVVAYTNQLKAVGDKYTCIVNCIKDILAVGGASTSFEIIGILPWEVSGVQSPRGGRAGVRSGMALTLPFIGSRVFIDRATYRNWADTVTFSDLSLMGHEAFHIAQQGIFGGDFYWMYLAHYFWNLAQEFSHYPAYRGICFEEAARDYQADFEKWLRENGADQWGNLCPCTD
jgi:hypothetical protein